MYSARHQQFLDGGAHAALEQHRPPAAAQRFQQREVLHVARAHLHAIGVLGHQFHIAVAHDFGDDGEAGGLLRLAQQFQPFEFHALEIVGRGARLEGSAAQHPRAGRRHAFGRLHDLLFALHRAGAGHHDELIAADLQPLILMAERSLLELAG